MYNIQFHNYTNATIVPITLWRQKEKITKARCQIKLKESFILNRIESSDSSSLLKDIWISLSCPVAVPSC